jgi:hypothetical protein
MKTSSSKTASRDGRAESTTQRLQCDGCGETAPFALGVIPGTHDCGGSWRCAPGQHRNVDGVCEKCSARVTAGPVSLALPTNHWETKTASRDGRPDFTGEGVAEMLVVLLSPRSDDDARNEIIEDLTDMGERVDVVTFADADCGTSQAGLILNIGNAEYQITIRKVS